MNIIICVVCSYSIYHYSIYFHYKNISFKSRNLIYLPRTGENMTECVTEWQVTHKDRIFILYNVTSVVKK